MPKLKTHKGTKKVLNIRKSGTITIGHPGSRHNLGKKSSGTNRKKRTQVALSRGDRRRLKQLIK
ncbi:MAG TPA: 50S ribosomal protein L35 [Bacilli bacterium]|nr:50S ribosomal protein L35 [Bacilli bacterium]